MNNHVPIYVEISTTGHSYDAERYAQLGGREGPARPWTVETSLRIGSACLVPGARTRSGAQLSGQRLSFANLLGQRLVTQPDAGSATSGNICDPSEAKSIMEDWLAKCSDVTVVRPPSHDLADYCRAQTDFEVAVSGFEVLAPAIDRALVHNSA